MSTSIPTSAEAAPSRWRTLLLAPFRWLGILLVPDRALPRAVSQGRYGGALVVVVGAALLAALTISSRVDLTEKVLGPQMQAGPPPGGSGGAAQSQPMMSDREFEEGMEKARTAEQVMSGLKAGVVLPVQIFLLALAAYLIARYVGGKPTLRRAMALASAAALPGAVKSLLEAVAASRHPVLLPSEVGTLVTSPLQVASPVLGKLAGALDPFLLWSVLLIALGLPAMAAMSRRRSWITVAVCFVLWTVVTRLVLAPAPMPHPGAPS